MGASTWRHAALALGLLLAACDTDPVGNYLGGAGDPIRGAALSAPQALGNTSGYRGRPADAALAAAQLEFLAVEMQEHPRYSSTVNPATISKLVVARAEMRQALGIAPEADGRLVVASLRRAAEALHGGSQAQAEAALSSAAFPAGPVVTLTRLANLPYLPRTAEAAGAVAQEVTDESMPGRRRR